jgi:toll-like receptor 2
MINMEAHHRRLINISLACGICAALMMTITMILIIQNQWRLKWYFFQLQKKGWRHFLIRNKPNFVYSAFILLPYSDEYVLYWVVHELLPQCDRWDYQICFEGRDFQVGVSKADAIIEAIDRSDKILFILTESFIRDNWCLFGLEMSIVKGLDHIILCQLDDFDVKTAPIVVVKLMDQVPYIKYVDRRSRSFWNKLKDLLANQVFNHE